LFPLVWRGVWTVPAQVSLLMAARASVVFYVVVQGALLLTADGLAIESHFGVGAFQRRGEFGGAFVRRARVVSLATGGAMGAVLLALIRDPTHFLFIRWTRCSSEAGILRLELWAID
jgi:hypothetical protein